MTQALYRQRRDIMLCYPFSEKRLLTYPTPWYVQPKLEGDRCLAKWDGNIGYVLYSSTGKPILNLPHINRALNNLNITTTLDGELYNHRAPHELIHGIVSRSVNIHRDYKLVQFHIFDVVMKGDFKKRLDYTRLVVKESEHIRRVRTHDIRDLKEVYYYYESELNDGYEGVVIRSPEQVYVDKRTTLMMKLKQREEDIYLCTAIFEEESIEGVKKQRLGAILVRDGDGQEFKVGSGFNDEQRKLYWNMPSLILGHLIRVRYQALTQKGIPKMASIKEIIND